MPRSRHFLRSIRLIAWLSGVTLGGWGCTAPTGDPPFPADIAVKPLPNSLTFFAFGDWGVYGLGDQTVLANRMDYYAQYLKPGFVALMGDNFYPAGVKSTTDAHWKQSFEFVYKGSNLPRLFYPVLGNHDYQQSTQAELDYNQLNPRWAMPARYYTTVYAVDAATNLRVVYLDTSPFVAEYRANPGGYPDVAAQNTARQVAWADSVLSHATERWTVVIGHHPVYSIGLDHGNQPELVQQLQPLLTKYKVPLYLNGHSHTLQHIRPAGLPTDYITAGTGGAPLGSVGPLSAEARFGQAAFGFAIISASATALRVSLVDEAGKLLYQVQR